MLKTTVSLIVNSQFPQYVLWGPALVTIPNDTFLLILGDKTPALGRSFAEAWEEFAPIAARAFLGTSTYIRNFGMTTDQHGIIEETFLPFATARSLDANGQIVGMLDTITETGETVRSGRHLELINTELGNTLKSVLAMTQAVTHQRIRRSANLYTARESVSKRRAAVARATDVLTSPIGNLPISRQLLIRSLLDTAKGALLLPVPPLIYRGVRRFRSHLRNMDSPSVLPNWRPL